MWGRVILGTVIVTLTILWLVAIWFLLLDPRTFSTKMAGRLVEQCILAGADYDAKLTANL
jgi:hypothetical protein